MFYTKMTSEPTSLELLISSWFSSHRLRYRKIGTMAFERHSSVRTLQLENQHNKCFQQEFSIFFHFFQAGVYHLQRQVLTTIIDINYIGPNNSNLPTFDLTHILATLATCTLPHLATKKSIKEIPNVTSFFWIKFHVSSVQNPFWHSITLVG